MKQTKTFADLEKEIGCGRLFDDEINGYDKVWDCGSILEGMIILCPVCQAKQDLLKEVKKIIAKDLKEWREDMRKEIFKWGIEEGGDKLHYNEIADEQYDKLKSQLGISEAET